MAGADFMPTDDSLSSDGIFDGTPVEVTAIVAEYLDSKDDLRALAVVSKIWTYGANTRLFRSIRISLAPTDSPQIGLQQWRYLLHRRESLTHVRKLEFVDERQHPATCAEKVQATEIQCKHNRQTPSYSDADAVCLVHFIRAMPRELGDFVWTSSRQFPRGLLEELLRYRRSCRLHIDPYQVPDEFFETMHSRDVYVDAKLLANSPSLHRITVHCCASEDQRLISIKVSAFLEMVGGRAPGLKKVCVLPTYPSSSPVGSVMLPQLPIALNATPRGSFTSLELGELGRRSRRYMERWFRFTNSALLEDLRLHDWLVESAWDHLSSLDWSSLRWLEICLPSNHWWRKCSWPTCSSSDHSLAYRGWFSKVVWAGGR